MQTGLSVKPEQNTKFLNLQNQIDLYEEQRNLLTHVENQIREKKLLNIKLKSEIANSRAQQCEKTIQKQSQPNLPGEDRKLLDKFTLFMGCNYGERQIKDLWGGENGTLTLVLSQGNFQIYLETVSPTFNGTQQVSSLIFKDSCSQQEIKVEVGTDKLEQINEFNKIDMPFYTFIDNYLHQIMRRNEQLKMEQLNKNQINQNFYC